MAGPVKAIQPEEKLSSSDSSNLNCMGAGEVAPPRVHTSARPAPVPAPAPLLRGRANTLSVLSSVLEVTTRPRSGDSGQTASPTPYPQQVLRAGSGTRVLRSTCMRRDESADACQP